MSALQGALERLTWAPIQLATRVGARPISPRLPHALVLALALEAREAGEGNGGRMASEGQGGPVPDVIRLAAQVEATPVIVADAIRALLRAGVLIGASDTAQFLDGTEPPPVRIAPRLLGPAPRAGALDWRWIATVTAGAPSAWVAAHALAEWLDGSDAWVSIPRNLLQPLLGSGLAGVRNALSGLVATSVLERREVAGRASHYRFSARARGVADTHSPPLGPESSSRYDRPTPSEIATTLPPSPLPPSGAAPSAVSSPGGDRVEVTIGGATFHVGPGARIAVNAPGMVVSFDVGTDGRTRVTVVPPPEVGPEVGPHTPGI